MSRDPTYLTLSLVAFLLVTLQLSYKASVASLTTTAAPSCPSRIKALWLYQGSPSHTEILGVFMQYAQRCNLTTTVYRVHDPTRDWSAFYQQVIDNGRTQLKDASSFWASFVAANVSGLLEEIGVIHLTFSDYRDLPALQKTAFRAHKCLVVLHSWSHLGSARDDSSLARDYFAAKMIFLTPVVGTPHLLPVIEPAAQTVLPLSQRKQVICLLGSGPFHAPPHNDQWDLNELQMFVSSSRRFRFWAASQQSPPQGFAWQEGDTYLSEVTSEQMWEAARQCAFIAVFPRNESFYISDRLTGSIPLGISANTPLLLSPAIASAYNFTLLDSIIGSMQEVLSKIEKITEGEYRSLLDGLLAYRSRVGKQNASLLRSLLDDSRGSGIDWVSTLLKHAQ